jgi:hypothetical protein
MSFNDRSAEIEVLFAVAFTAVCLGVLIAVIGKAFRKFPYQPDEFKVFFTRPTLPRWFSKIYVVHPPPRPKRAAKKSHLHENSHTQWSRRHGG